MTELQSNSAAFTGHRRMTFRAGDDMDALRRRLDTLLVQLYRRGYRNFYSGMAMGFDLVAARAVIGLRRSHSDVRLIAAVPFAGQARRYPALWRSEYERVLAQADRVDVLAERYEPHIYLRRDRYMVERASVVAAWFDGRSGGTAYTVDFARSLGREVVNLFDDGQYELF